MTVRRHFLKKYIFSILFLLTVFVFAGVNFRHAYPELKAYIEKGEWQDISECVRGMESVINDNVYRKYAWIEAYGFTEKVLGSNVDNGFDYVKTKDGQLQYSDTVTGWTDVHKIVNKTAKIRNLAKENGARFLMVLVPQKYIEGETEFEPGIPYADTNEDLDEIIKAAEKKKIDCMDTREYFQEIKEQSGQSVFYNTDHHWRPEAGFVVYTHLLEKLEKNLGKELNPDGFYTNLDNYNVDKYEDFFLGSMGRETGVVYAGLDDFTLIYPKYPTDYVRRYRITADGDLEEREGPVCDSLLSMGNLWYDGPVYQSERYGTYLNGINVEDSITNRRNPDGPRVLMIRDSYMSVSNVFLAGNCSQLDTIWSIQYDGDFRSLVENGNYDYVIVQLSGLNMNNERFLDFVE